MEQSKDILNVNKISWFKKISMCELILEGYSRNPDPEEWKEFGNEDNLGRGSEW